MGASTLAQHHGEGALIAKQRLSGGMKTKATRGEFNTSGSMASEAGTPQVRSNKQPQPLDPRHKSKSEFAVVPGGRKTSTIVQQTQKGITAAAGGPAQ